MTTEPETTVAEPCWWRALLKNRYIVGFIKFTLPFAIGVVLFAVLYMIEPYPRFLTLSGLAAAYFFPPAGKESIIPIAILMGYPWWLITFVIGMIDIAVSLFVVWNFDLALKIPLIGRLLDSGMTAARNYTETQPCIKGISTAGLILFVFFPFQGTGSMNGSILGRLLGMNEARVFGCVSTGSLASTLIIALGADVLLDVYQKSPALGIGLLVAAVLAVVAGVILWRMRKNRLRGRRR
ncbi:MAG: small multi-drug export protein [Methanomicrobiales archaeon]|nr:small multi-drug export protein [Methanomicrobiales archaeon]